LLQGFLSASMQLHVATENLPAESPVIPHLRRITDLMGRVIDEGRTAVQGLRLAHRDSFDLEQAFSRIAQELSIQEEIGFRIVVEGPPRPLHPLARDEVYRIGREAVINAFRHAQARNIVVHIEYLEKQLRLLVCDDGCGIDLKVLREGREGHWGISGMRERAEKIGAKLRLSSAIPKGTEVELIVPGHAAFQREPRSQLIRWIYSRITTSGSEN
jgi:signal transduction histidine kinase